MMTLHMMNKTCMKVMALVIVGLICRATALADQPQSQRSSRQKGIFGGNIACGSSKDIAARVETCAKPTLDIMEGTQEKWLRTEDDSHELCLNLTGAEKCVRDEGRRCGKGIQKTIISTLAGSVQRARKRECVRSNYGEILRTMECTEKNQDKFRFLVANVTNQFRAIDKQMTNSDKKINGICCAVISMETNMKSLLNSVCPKQTPMVMRLYRATLEDAIELVCRSVKCDNVFSGIVFDKVKLDPDKRKHSGLIEVILSIIFSLDSN